MFTDVEHKGSLGSGVEVGLIVGSGGLRGVWGVRSGKISLGKG